MRIRNVLRRQVHVAALLFLFAAGFPATLSSGEIHTAAAGDLARVRALLAADPTLLEAKGNRGMTPLGFACFGGPPSFKAQPEVALFLIDQGANVNAKENSGYTPLHRVIYSRGQDMALIERLIEKGADINAPGTNGRTPLNSAAQSGNVELAKFLIAHGADVSAGSDYCGPINPGDLVGTVLQVAIQYAPREDMAILLAEKGARLGHKDAAGNDELHLAAIKGYAELARILIKHGADVRSVNGSGRTALYYASKYGFRSVADVLIAAGAKQTEMVESNFGVSPQLTAALEEGEAYLWYLASSPGGSHAVKTKHHLLVFNPPAPDDSREAGLANGHLNPTELSGQQITAFLTWSWSESSPETAAFFDLAKRMPGVALVSALKPAAGSAGSRDVLLYRLAVPHESFSEGGVLVHAIPAMTEGPSGGGLGYLVEADGVKIFHAGFHAAADNSAEQVEKFRREIDFLRSFGPIDIALLPVNSHIDVAYEPYLYLLDQLSPRAIYLTDANQPEEHPKCAEVLRARKIPVLYPEKGSGKGERFHFLRERLGGSSTPTGAARSAEDD